MDYYGHNGIMGGVFYPPPSRFRACEFAISCETSDPQTHPAADVVNYFQEA